MKGRSSISRPAARKIGVGRLLCYHLYLFDRKKGRGSDRETVPAPICPFRSLHVLSGETTNIRGEDGPCLARSAPKSSFGQEGGGGGGGKKVLDNVRVKHPKVFFL